MIAFLASVLLGAVDFQPCEVDGQKAECGRVQVPENRAQARGRIIDLHVALIRHDRARQSADAVFILAGGPGVGATGMAGFAVERFRGASRDLVFVDVRGTGRSNPLDCDFGGSDENPQQYLNGFVPLERVRACRDALSERADLTQYTTRAIVEDLQTVREKLGYRTIDLYGSSYGTRVAQEFMRHYPASVRLAILDGVTSTSMISPASLAPDAQHSLEGVLTLCTSDPECRAAYPALRDDYQAMVRRVADGIQVTILNAKGGEKHHLQLDRGLFGEAFRNFLYRPEVYVKVPYIVHRAARGEFEEFGSAALDYARGIRTLNFGMFLSVTCTEDLPRLDLAASRQAASGTLLGTYRIDQQVAACALWPRGVPDPARVSPLRSSIPTLLLSGEFDPVTPPKYAAEVARTLSNSAHVIVPKGSHANEAGGCLARISAEAVNEGDVRELDSSCVRDIAAPSFVLWTEGE
ncbi:MAG TPA: alpha/beta hydrolase [Steroidobacter sp.]|uniref:alpha/beta hydrolase n=1 Tax=Steroidobacter sp. TaxID=1978227 RepID=UPI002EDB282E